MTKQNPLDAQCYVKGGYTPIFPTGGDLPHLLYACHIRSDFSGKHPRFLHSHKDLVEMVLICNGSGQYMIGNMRYHVRKGDLLIYNAGTVHDEKPVEGSDLDFFTIAAGSIHLPGLKKNELVPKSAGCRFATGQYFNDLHPLFQLIFRNLRDETYGAEQFCNSLLHALISKTVSLVAEPQGDSLSEPQEESFDSPGVLTERTIKFINDNYMNPITIQDIAARMHASTYYIAHIFKEETGYSPIQYLLRRRIGEAQTLLITTDMSIVDIAGAVGYETQSYFTTQFTKHVGMPPKQFRQRYKK